MTDTIRKNFESGWSRYHFFRKHSITPRPSDPSIRSAVMLKFGGLINAIRHVTTPVQFVTYVPWVIVFEATNKLGYLSAAIFSRKSVDRRNPEKVS